jgi:predicted GH43/DUF377 family glycosyl hydrolase
MKLKLVIFITLFIFLIVINSYKVLAGDSFIKSELNPLEFTNEIDDWNEIGQRQPFILYEESKYKLWYTSQSSSLLRIGYAESSDLNSFTSVQILNLNYDSSYHFHDPTIVKVENQYHLYFAVSNGGGNYKILKTISTDGINFNDEIVEVLTPGTIWDKNAVSGPSLIYDNSNFYMFFTGWNGLQWSAGLAISEDGVNWIKCDNNPIIDSASGPSITKEGDKYRLYFHTSSATAIESVETEDPLTCNSIWSNRTTILSKDQSYDSKLITDPSIIKLNSTNYLFYSGLSGSNNWTINLANRFSEVTEPLIQKFILIPGFMTTWNKNAVVYNDSSSVLEWKILDFINEYNGIINTFKSLGLVKNRDFYVFAYDWRKPVEDLTLDFESFLNEKELNISGINLNVIGHSFGGIIGRIYLQNNPDKISKLITVGSPHQGTAKVYHPIQAGKIDLSTDFLSLAQNIVINLNRTLNQSNKDIIRSLIPSLFDLYPNYEFLKNQKGIAINIDSLKIKNKLLSNYNDISMVKDKIFSLYSDYDQALFGFKVEPQSGIHKLFEHYEDGFPTESIFDFGDKNLPKISTRFGNNFIQVTGDHEEIIYKKESIKKILDLLNIEYVNDDIVEGKKTVINPSLIFVIKSPAIMEVTIDDKIYKEEDGLIFIPNADSGEYKLTLQGTDFGKYTVLVGQISQNNELWEHIDGSIIQDPPSSQIDIFSVEFDNQTALSILPSPTPTDGLSPSSAPTPTQTPTPTYTLSPTPTPALISNAYSTYNNYTTPQTPKSSNLSTFSLPFKQLTEEPGEVLGKSNDKLLCVQDRNVDKIKENTKISPEFNYWKIAGLGPVIGPLFSGVTSFLLITFRLFFAKKTHL